MISPSYVDGLELRIKELTKSNRSFVSALQKAEAYNVQLERQLSDERMENLRLQTDRDALAAHNSELVSACKLAIDMFVANECNVPNTIETLQDAIDGNPQQCLAEIKAEAGRAGYVEGYLDGYNDNALDEFNQDSYADLYAAKVRQGGGE